MVRPGLNERVQEGEDATKVTGAVRDGWHPCRIAETIEAADPRSIQQGWTQTKPHGPTLTYDRYDDGEVRSPATLAMFLGREPSRGIGESSQPAHG